VDDHEEQIWFIGPCTCDHDREEHGWGSCDVDDCDCKAGLGGMTSRPQPIRPSPMVTETRPMYRHWHRAVPGPLYWDYRCLVCGDDVDAHAPWWLRLWRRSR
jgi:hypothetical protein